MMLAGKLRHMVSILKPVTAQSETGEALTTWQEHGKAWASIEPIQGQEYWQAAQMQSDVSTKITIRHLAGVLPQMRVAFGDQLFLIVSVIDAQLCGKTMQLMCRASIT